MSLRDAAYLIAVDRVAKACRQRVGVTMSLYRSIANTVGIA